ncbi:Cleavage stimulating factor 64 [Yarrowia sp. C11]|nr:Cleavage stimulating factor 64 [Yarrowia sp. E02]KAG5371938.1 Cleavage stimulating factor 64 [Yarrowia sp. C11]
MDRNTPQPPSRTLFVGNFPFEMTEPEVRDMLGRHGTVVGFRLVTERGPSENRRSKGYGFVEYSSIPEAERALESLRDVRIGQRQIRTAFTQDMQQHRAERAREGYGGGGGRDGGQGYGGQGQGYGRDGGRDYRSPHPDGPGGYGGQGGYGQGGHGQGGHGGQYGQGQGGYGGQGQGQGYGGQGQGGHGQGGHGGGYGYDRQQSTPNASTPNPSTPTPAPVPTLTTPDATSTVLSALQPNQLLDLIAHLKTLITKNPAEAAQILQVSEPITYAAVQAMLLMGLIDAKVVQQVVGGQQPQAPAHSTPQPQHATPPPQAHVAAPTHLDPQQQQMINQVLALTDAQLASLPHDQRATLQQLRENYRRGIFS